MKKIKFISLLLVAIGACFMCSCTANESFIYQGKEGICFTSASAHYAFGALPLNQQTVKVKVVLEKTGFVSVENKSYCLTIDTTQTNVRWGVEAEKPNLERVWKAGLWHDTLYISIKRDALLFEKTYRMVFHISNKCALSASVDELSAYTLTFNNQLEKPQWWTELSYWLGEYEPIKYQKYIEITGAMLTTEEVKDHQYEVLRTFKRVKQFFEDNPRDGILFPSVRWPV